MNKKVMAVMFLVVVFFASNLFAVEDGYQRAFNSVASQIKPALEKAAVQYVKINDERIEKRYILHSATGAEVVIYASPIAISSMRQQELLLEGQIAELKDQEKLRIITEKQIAALQKQLDEIKAAKSVLEISVEETI